MSMVTASNMWKAGGTTQEVAEYLGLTERSFYRARKKDPELFPPRDNKSSIAQKHLTKACSLWNEGKSIGEISKVIGISANIIGGVMQRNRDMFPKRRVEEKARNANAKRALFYEVNAGNPPKPKEKYSVYDISRLPHAVTLMDLDTKRCCTWAVTEHPKGVDNLFCGEVKAGKNYCREHQTRSVRVA